MIPNPHSVVFLKALFWTSFMFLKLAAVVYIFDDRLFISYRKVAFEGDVYHFYSWVGFWVSSYLKV